MTFVPEGQRILGCGDRNNLNLRLLEECNQQLAPFVGAGISMKFGYPSWHDLMVRLGRATDSLETVKSLLANNQFEEAAEHISASLPSVFDDVIKDIFSEHEELSRPVSGVLTALATVSNGPVLTTNFDKLLERAFENAGARFEHVYPGSRIKEAQYAIQVRKRCLLKLHGDFEDSESMVLTMTQYVREYGSHDSSQVDLTLPLPGVISQAFQSMPMLFVGCSLKFDRTMQVIGRIAKKYTRLKHFALLSEGERSTQRLHELDVATIRPLFYAERQHERVDDFLACLAEYVEGIDHKQHLAKESATDVLISKVNEGPIYTDNAIATTTDSNPRREKALSKKISGDADERVRINGYKLFYFHKMSGISFLQLSVACGLDKKVLRNLENMNRRVSLLHADPFAKCTRQLLEKLEAVLHCPGSSMTLHPDTLSSTQSIAR